MFFITDKAIEFVSTDEEKKKYAPLPEGDYVVAITDAEIEQDDKGDRFKLTLVVDDESSNFHERKIWDSLYIEGRSVSPKAVEIGQKRLNQVFKVLGVEGFQNYNEAQTIAQSIIGANLTARVTQREWEGKTYNNVKGYGPVHKKVPPSAASQAVKKVTTKGFR